MENKKNIIPLDFTNISSADSTVDLFYHTSSNVTETYYKTTVTFGLTQKVQGLNSGASFSDSFVEANITDFINAVNLFYAGNMFFSAELVSGSVYNILTRILNTNYSLTGIVMSVTTSIPVEYDVIFGTTVAVTTDGIDYTQTVNELQFQPCILTSVNVYATTIDQVSTRFYKTERETNGHSVINVDSPKVDPMQTQFAIENIDINFSPSPLNILQYTFKGSQSVLMFFYYKQIDILNLSSEKNNTEQIKITKQTSSPMIKVKQSINPLFDLVGVHQEKRVSIKTVISKGITSREISDEEVYNSFDGIDYSEDSPEIEE